jgi:26S proteasome regulatory subunit N9
MKALSLGLIKGSLDEVDQTVNVTWVQPKVLDHQQIAIVVNQLTEWSDRVKRTLVAVEEQALELYV